VVERAQVTPAKPYIDLMVDSGAYSAWKSGAVIDISEYCDWIEANQSYIKYYINLDVINPNDPEAAARASLDNYLYMRKRGLHPMIVFHAKESFKWLKAMLTNGADYIGLAALSLGSHTLRSEWYKHAWDHISAPSGEPVIKAHALGEGRYECLAAFPWYSADSASWIFTANNAGVRMADGQTLSQSRDGVGQGGKLDVAGLADMDLGELAGYLEGLGIEPNAFLSADQREKTVLRTYIALQYYLRQERDIFDNHKWVRHKSSGLFTSHNRVRDKPTIALEGINYYSAIGNGTHPWAAIAFSRARRVLFSYAIIKLHQRHLKEFVYDPIGLCERGGYPAVSYSVLKEFVKC
jgi:hypothetical protein